MHALHESAIKAATPLRRMKSGLWPGLICRLPKAVLVIPMVIQWLWLAICYRSLSLPSAADPSIAIGGLAGESKSAYFDQVAPALRWHLARTAAIKAGVSAAIDARAALERLNLSFPVIVKPDIGWCGFGVRRVDDVAAMDAYIDSFPAGETFLLQEYLDLPGEAGLFYVRWPDQRRRGLLSLTVREPPQIEGDGVSTLLSLVARHERLRSRITLYDNLDRVPRAGEVIALSTVWSYRMGGCYRDFSEKITAELEAAIDAIASSMPNFHVARFDIRFASLERLTAGKNFKILEINGAGSEAIEFFDPTVPFFTAYRGILAKQAMVFAIGDQNRSRGFAPCGWRALAAAFRHQGRLLNLYPESN